MITTITLITASVLGLFFSLSKTGLFQKFITVGLTTSLLIRLWAIDTRLIIVGLLMFLLFAFISTFYASTAKGLKTIERFTIGTMGMLLILGTLVKIQHYPGQGVLRIALIIPTLLFIHTTIRNGKQQPKEFGFMLIWTALAINQLTQFFF